MKLLMFLGMLVLPFLGISQTALLEVEVTTFRLPYWGQETNSKQPTVSFALEESNTSVSVNHYGLNFYLLAANPLDTNWDTSTKGMSLLERELDQLSELHVVPDPRDFVTAGLKITF